MFVLVELSMLKGYGSQIPAKETSKKAIVLSPIIIHRTDLLSFPPGHAAPDEQSHDGFSSGWFLKTVEAISNPKD